MGNNLLLMCDWLADNGSLNSKALVHVFGSGIGYRLRFNLCTCYHHWTVASERLRVGWDKAYFILSIYGVGNGYGSDDIASFNITIVFGLVSIIVV